MTDGRAEWGDILVHFLALAARMEREGQYNIAKLLRAAADSMARRAANELTLPADRKRLTEEVERAVAALSGLGVEDDLVAALSRGSTAMAEGRLPLINETPHPYVCRTCGHAALDEPASRCPTCGAWPATFQQFLPVYWLNDLEPFAALQRLRDTPKEVKRLLDGLSEDVLSKKPKDGGWSMREVVSHLRDAQGVLSARLQLLLEEENPRLTSQAVFEWVTREEAQSPTTQEIFDTYGASRQETVARLESIPLKDWWRTGQHEEFGPITLRQQVSYFAAHESTHLPQIESLRHQIVRG